MLLQLGDRLTVGRVALDHLIGVRIPVSQPTPIFPSLLRSPGETDDFTAYLILKNKDTTQRARLRPAQSRPEIIVTCSRRVRLIGKVSEAPGKMTH